MMSDMEPEESIAYTADNWKQYARKLEQQLAAEREAREKAEELATGLELIVTAAQVFSEAELGIIGQVSSPAWRQAIRQFKQRAESAEQKLRDAQEQEPVAFGSQCTRTKKWGYIWHTLDDVLGWVNLQHQSRDDCTYSAPIPFYAAPIPPADVAELINDNESLTRKLGELSSAAQDEIDRLDAQKMELENKNAELTRKLAEQQAVFRKIQYLAGINDNTCESLQHSEEELTKLLEEAKRQVVPEGWQLVPKHSPIVKIELWDGKFWQPEGSSNYNRMMEAMIAAAPQPNGVDK